MTTDIFGWVETRTPPSEWWDAAIQIRHIVHRRYGIFASLFGVRNGGIRPTEVGRFRAIVPGRGASPRASEFYAEEFDGSGVGATWVLWSELTAIDWEEEGESTSPANRRISCMRRQDQAGDASDGEIISPAAGRPRSS